MDKNNSFDLLRFIFCVFVIISHCAYISGIENSFDIDKVSHGQTYLGEIGVMGFFSLSGFLITGSFLRAKNIFKFTFNRAVRIFPGFWCCIFLTAFAIAPLIYYVEYHTIKNFNFFSGYGSYTYVRQNFFTYIRQAEISHVLDKSKTHGLNGSLWSLFHEIVCYNLTIILGLSGLLSKHKKLFLAIFLCLYLYYAFSRSTTDTPEYYKLYISYFCGTAFYLISKRLSLKSVSILFACFILLFYVGHLQVFLPVLITLIFLNLFSVFTFKMPLDISYGLYIYGFPVQQLLNSMNLKNQPLFLLTSLLVSALLAVLSFVLIERPFMRLKKILWV